MDDRVKSAFFALFAVNGLFSRVAEEGMKIGHDFGCRGHVNGIFMSIFMSWAWK